jgi:hypothetical protein
MISYKYNIIENNKNMFYLKIVPCKDYNDYLNIQNIKSDNYLNELENNIFEDYNTDKNKKKISDLNDGFDCILDFLEDNDISNLSMIDKYHYEKMTENKKYKKIIFLNKIKDLPIYRSHIHKMGDMRTSPKRYLWLKKDFSIEEKAKINIELLLKCDTNEYPKYGEIRKIFTLYENGLLCQLPSYSGMIRTHSHDPTHKEYMFIVCFVLHSDYGYIPENNDLNEINEINDKKFKNIYFLDEQYELNIENNEQNQALYKLVINKMLEELNYRNENYTNNFYVNY